jgi:hypothetical protein
LNLVRYSRNVMAICQQVLWDFLVWLFWVWQCHEGSATGADDVSVENVPRDVYLFLSQQKLSTTTMLAFDRNYTAIHTHVRQSVHLSALLITWFTWGDGVQRRYASDVAFLHRSFPSHSW